MLGAANPIVIVPARMASLRLPGKPLADLGGRPMIVHVWQRAMEADLGPVVVAAADAEIATAVSAAGGTAVLTRPEHASGSDRVHEAMDLVDPAGRHDVVVNLQGDLPTIDPEALAAVLRPLVDPEVDIATLVAPLAEIAARDDPNVVKAVVALAPGMDVGRALYFSRAVVPFGEGPLYHHVGVYAFRRPSLVRFIRLPPGVLERRERLEQLRALEYGMRIDAALIAEAPPGVDTAADLDRARALLYAAGR